VTNDSADSDSPDIPRLMRSVLGLAKRTDLGVELQEIPEWDGAGRRRLVVAINDSFGIEVHEDDLLAAKTLAALCDFVNLAIERSLADADPDADA
jgi:acyl carrier protein